MTDHLQLAKWAIDRADGDLVTEGYRERQIQTSIAHSDIALVERMDALLERLDALIQAEHTVVIAGDFDDSIEF